MTMLIRGAVLIDGVHDRPIEGHSILISDNRIEAIGPDDELLARAQSTFDAEGKFAIPGLMNANVHLFCDFRLESLARYEGRFDALIIEAAQMALRQGVTTVFDTWGPRRPLMAARDAIAAGKAVGSRIFCAGNIVGFDGPFSPDFIARAAKVASPAFVKRIDAMFVENVGRHLMWRAPEEVGAEVASYIDTGIDFVKYAANEHFGSSSGAFLAFSPEVQQRIVATAHEAGVTAQAHTMSIEGLRIAVEAGCDLIQHANHTGPVLIPDQTIDMMANRVIGTVVFPQTESRLEWLRRHESYRTDAMWKAMDENVRKLIAAPVSLLLATDGVLLAPETRVDPSFERNWGGPWEGSLFNLETGHHSWLVAMEEKGCAPMRLLHAATRNIAEAYGKAEDLGTLETGKLADIVLLDGNPLQSAANYAAIHAVIKDGRLVNREALPTDRYLTRPLEHVEEEERYIAFMGGSLSLPPCSCAHC